MERTTPREKEEKKIMAMSITLIVIFLGLLFLLLSGELDLKHSLHFRDDLRIGICSSRFVIIDNRGLLVDSLSEFRLLQLSSLSSLHQSDLEVMRNVLD